jgi:hypothetical protein
MFRIASSTAPTSLLRVTALAQRFDRQSNCSASVGPLSSRCIRPHARERIPKETTKPAARAVAATSRQWRALEPAEAPGDAYRDGPARGRRGPRASGGSEGAEIHGPIACCPNWLPGPKTRLGHVFAGLLWIVVIHLLWAGGCLLPRLRACRKGTYRELMKRGSRACSPSSKPRFWDRR